MNDQSIYIHKEDLTLHSGYKGKLVIFEIPVGTKFFLGEQKEREQNWFHVGGKGVLERKRVTLLDTEASTCNNGSVNRSIVNQFPNILMID